MSHPFGAALGLSAAKHRRQQSNPARRSTISPCPWPLVPPAITTPPSGNGAPFAPSKPATPPRWRRYRQSYQSCSVSHNGQATHRCPRNRRTLAIFDNDNARPASSLRNLGCHPSTGGRWCAARVRSTRSRDADKLRSPHRYRDHTWTVPQATGSPRSKGCRENVICHQPYLDVRSYREVPRTRYPRARRIKVRLALAKWRVARNRSESLLKLDDDSSAL